MSLDNFNYHTDPRVCEAAEAPVLYLEDGQEIPLPMSWVVCEVCNGAGKHVNPSIDAGGISAETFHDDPDFAESYMRGDYDQTCNRCRGRTTVPGVDWKQLTPEHRAAYEAQLEDDAAYEAERAAEIRMGC